MVVFVFSRRRVEPFAVPSPLYGELILPIALLMTSLRPVFTRFSVYSRDLNSILIQRELLALRILLKTLDDMDATLRMTVTVFTVLMLLFLNLKVIIVVAMLMSVVVFMSMRMAVVMTMMMVLARVDSLNTHNEFILSREDDFVPALPQDLEQLYIIESFLGSKLDHPFYLIQTIVLLSEL